MHNQIFIGGYQLARLWISDDGFTVKIFQLLVCKKKYCVAVSKKNFSSKPFLRYCIHEREARRKSSDKNDGSRLILAEREAQLKYKIRVRLSVGASSPSYSLADDYIIHVCSRYHAMYHSIHYSQS